MLDPKQKSAGQGFKKSLTILTIADQKTRPVQTFARIASIFFAARPVSGMKCEYIFSVVVASLWPKI
jgi:hypothetical protein